MMRGSVVRLFILMIGLMTTGVAASQSQLYPEIRQPATPVWVQLDNGFQVVHYAPEGSQEIIRLCLQVYVGWSSEHRDQVGISEMLRQTIWEGTDELSRIQILTFLDQLPMDPELNGYTMPESTFYELSVAVGDYRMLESSLH